jgi:hypothetical protein
VRSPRGRVVELGALARPVLVVQDARVAASAFATLQLLAGVHFMQVSKWLGGHHYFQYCSHSTVAKTVNDAA